MLGDKHRPKNKGPGGRGRGRGGGHEGPKPDAPAVSPDDMHTRMICVFCSLIGQVVDVSVKEGTVFRGILHTVHPDSVRPDAGVVLRMARIVAPGMDEKTVERLTPTDTLVINWRDFIDMVAPDSFLGGDRGASSKGSGFRTDSEISGRALMERELVQWEGGDEDELGPDPEWMGMAASDDVFDERTGEWDQFKANKLCFGIESTFDENEYTTQLNRDTLTDDQREFARLKALEIEKGDAGGNLHRQMERLGDRMDNTDFDEEELYGAVVGTGRAQLQGRTMVTGGGAPNMLNALFANAQSDGQAPMPQMPTQMKDGAVHASDLAPGGAGGRVDSMQDARLKVRSIMQNDRCGNKGKGMSPNSGASQPGSLPDALNLTPASPTLSPEAKADFDKFKADERKNQQSSSRREHTISDFRAFSDNLKKPKSPTLKPNADSAAKAKEFKLTFDPKKEFKFNVKATAFVPTAKKEASDGKPPAETAPPGAAAHAAPLGPGPAGYPMGAAGGYGVGPYDAQFQPQGAYPAGFLPQGSMPLQPQQPPYPAPEASSEDAPPQFAYGNGMTQEMAMAQAGMHMGRPGPQGGQPGMMQGMMMPGQGMPAGYPPQGMMQQGAYPMQAAQGGMMFTGQYMQPAAGRGRGGMMPTGPGMPQGGPGRGAPQYMPQGQPYMMMQQGGMPPAAGPPGSQPAGPSAGPSAGSS